jgi:hypothetical protein
MAAGFGLAWFQVLDGRFCVVIAAIGGFVEGWSFMYLMNAETIPILTRYTTLNDEESQKALEESKDA